MKYLSKIRLWIIDNKVITIFLVLYFVLFSGLAILRHYTFKTALFDYGLEVQVIRNTSEFNFFQSGVEVSNYLGDHFSPLPIIISALVYKVFPHDITIFLLQTLIVVIGLLGFYKLIKIYLKNKFLIYLVLFSIALSPGFQGVLLFDYHPVVYAIPFLIWGIYFNEKKKYIWSIVLFLLACFVKEDIGIFVGLFGILSILNKNKAGIIYLLTGFILTTFAIEIVIPSIRLTQSDTLSRYEYFGNSFLEIVRKIVIDPLRTAKYMFTLERIVYFLKITFLTCLIPLVKFKYFIILFLPLLLINLLSGDSLQYSAVFHYDTSTTIALYYILVLSIRKLIESDKLHMFNATKIITVGLIITLTIYLPFSKYFRELTTVNIFNYEDYKELQNIKKLIPQDQIVAVSNHLGAHFVEYTNLQIYYPDLIKYANTPNYILIYKSEVKESEKTGIYLKLENNSITYSSDSFILYKISNN